MGLLPPFWLRPFTSDEKASDGHITQTKSKTSSNSSAEEVESGLMSETQHAKFLHRVGAHLIDITILLFAIVGPVLLIYPLIPRLLRVLALPALAFLVPLIYFTMFESSRLQATPGKMALGLKVTSLTGERITPLNAIGRSLARIIAGSLTGDLGYLVALFTKKKQGLHDLMAKTIVVQNRNEER